MPSRFIPDKTCVNCASPIPWRPGRRGRANATYCSETCRRSHPDVLPDKVCLTCGGPIPWREGREMRQRARFCGDPCKFAYQREHPTNYRGARETRPCAICGTEFSYYPSVQQAAQYCSRKCKGIGHSATMTGRRRVTEYTSAATFRVLVRRQFLDRCAICGWDLAPNDVAHIVARKDGGKDDAANVVMLCPNHHRLFDTGAISVETVLAARPNCLP